MHNSQSSVRRNTCITHNQVCAEIRAQFTTKRAQKHIHNFQSSVRRGNCISTTIGSYVHTIIEICIHTAIDKCMLTLIGSISTYREISLSLMKKIAGSVAELLMSFRREGACAQQTRRRNVSARVHQHILRRFHLAWWRKIAGSVAKPLRICMYLKET